MVSYLNILFQNGPQSFYDREQIHSFRLRTLTALHCTQYLLSVNIHGQAAFNILPPDTLYFWCALWKHVCIVLQQFQIWGHATYNLPCQYNTYNSKGLYFFALLMNIANASLLVTYIQGIHTSSSFAQPVSQPGKGECK